jgi:ABC-type branched-subunit amino acid transport system ATPase component
LPASPFWKTSCWGFHAHIQPSKAASEARGVLKYLQMEKVMDFMARGLPLAMLKRLEIARALATRPKLILLDEVVAGLSTAEALKLAELLQKLPERGISAVGGVEHVMRVVMSIADRRSFSTTALKLPRAGLRRSCACPWSSKPTGPHKELGL